jgi:hypothetical protein
MANMSKRRARRFLALTSVVALGLALSSCGGSGSGSEPDTGTGTPTTVLRSYPSAALLAADIDAAGLGCSEVTRQETTADDSDEGVSESATCRLDDGTVIDLTLFRDDSARREWFAFMAWYGCADTGDPYYLYVHGDGWLITHFLVGRMERPEDFPAVTLAGATGGEAHTLDCAAIATAVEEMRSTGSTDPAEMERFYDEILGEGTNASSPPETAGSSG